MPSDPPRPDDDATLAEPANPAVTDLAEQGTLASPELAATEAIGVPRSPEGGSPRGSTPVTTPTLGPLPDLDGWVGPYELLEPLGQGGMGIVYLARQASPIERLVALKLIRPARGSREVVARFEHERQTLALMRHPGIAQVYDAGTAPAGQPYFVMEYVNGLPITDYCEQQKLGVRERLVLFISVCRAVQHAHQKGVIHRDLKPDNVLVEAKEGRPVAKVIDFGIAKAVGDPLRLDLTATRVDGVLGTPAYMSPEQADPDLCRDLDTRTDVYSLGVVLYELLAGALPFDAESRFQYLRKVLEESPPLPSLRLRRRNSQKGEGAEATAEDSFLVQPGQLRGDLDWIVLRAMEKDRSRRYGSVADLADDLERHLDDQPVAAGPPTVSYRLSKFVRRHRAAVIAAALLVAALVAGSLGTAAGLVRSLRAEARAEGEASKARAIHRFLEDMLTAADPAVQGREVRVVEVLDRAASQLDRRFAEQPEVGAAVRSAVGRTYLALGQTEQAAAQLDQAFAVRSALGPEHPDFAEAQRDRARLLLARGETEAALALAQEALARQEESLGAEHPDTLESRQVVGTVLEELNRLDEAEAAMVAVVEARSRQLGEDHPETLEARSALASILIGQGRFAEAEGVLRDVLHLQEDLLGQEHPATQSTLNSLAGSLLFQGKFDEVEGLARRLWEIQQKVLGEDHPRTLATANNLTVVLSQLGRWSEAEALARQTLDSRRRTLGESHPQTADSLSSLATLIKQQSRYGEAEPLLRQAVVLHVETRGPEHPNTLVTRTHLADLLVQTGRLAEGEAEYRQILAARRETAGPDHPKTLSSLRQIALLLVRQGKEREALEVLRETLDRRRRVLGEDNTETFESRADLLDALSTFGPEEEFDSVLTAALERWRQLPQGLAVVTLEALRLVGLASLERGRSQEGREILMDLAGRAESAEELDRLVLGSLRRWSAAHPEVATGTELVRQLEARRQELLTEESAP